MRSGYLPRGFLPVQVVHGEAPAALAPLPDPDAAFVGGGGADLDAILDLCCARARRAVVVTLAIVERVSRYLPAEPGREPVPEGDRLLGILVPERGRADFGHDRTLDPGSPEPGARPRTRTGKDGGGSA